MSAYDEGFEARQRGKEATANPYGRWSEKWFDWADGWKDLDEHLRLRDECLDQIGWFG